MTNNIRFKIIAGKINKIPEFYTIFARNMLDYIIRQRDRSHGRGQMIEAEAEAKISASRPLWPRGLNITAIQSATDTGVSKRDVQIPSRQS